MGSDSPALSKMGGSDWAATKGKARKAVRELAVDLVKLYSARMAAPGFAFSPDTPWQRELEEAFPFVETPDQLTTIDEVKADMERPIPMDRLIAGDVGFGKTEIAVRAAFKAIQDQKQVALIAPRPCSSNNIWRRSRSATRPSRLIFERSRGSKPTPKRKRFSRGSPMEAWIS